MYKEFDFDLKFKEIMKGLDTVMILAHMNPDGDAAGSVLGLSHYLKVNYPQYKVIPYLSDKLDKGPKKMVKNDQVFHPFIKPEMPDKPFVAVVTMDGKAAYIIIDRKEKEKSRISYEDIHPISGIIRDCEGIHLGFTMYEEEPDIWRCSFRSDGKWINVNELLLPFGGGGHAGAAGLRKGTENVEELKQQILERIAEMT